MVNWRERQARVQALLAREQQKEEFQRAQKGEIEVRKHEENVARAREVLDRLCVRDALGGIRSEYWDGEGEIEDFEELRHYVGRSDPTLERGLRLRANVLRIEQKGPWSAGLSVNIRETTISIGITPLEPSERPRLYVREDGLFGRGDALEMSRVIDLIRRYGLRNGIQRAFPYYNDSPGGLIHESIYFNDPDAQIRLDRALLAGVEHMQKLHSFPQQTTDRALAFIRDVFPVTLWTEGLDEEIVRQWAIAIGALPVEPERRWLFPIGFGKRKR